MQDQAALRESCVPNKFEIDRTQKHDVHAAVRCSQNVSAKICWSLRGIVFVRFLNKQHKERSCNADFLWVEAKDQSVKNVLCFFICICLTLVSMCICLFQVYITLCLEIYFCEKTVALSRFLCLYGNLRNYPAFM